MPKYNQVAKVSHAGYSFASKSEAALFDLLKLRQRSGEITEIKPQDRVRVCCRGSCGHNQKIEYIADFRCQRPGSEYFWVEMKGFETDVWRIKRRLWFHTGPGILEVWKRNGRGLFLAETIIPTCV